LVNYPTITSVTDPDSLADKKINEKYTGVAIAIGAGVGTALGVALDNIALGVSLGAGVGMVFAFLRARANK
jgi:hypothetical protein